VGYISGTSSGIVIGRGAVQRPHMPEGSSGVSSRRRALRATARAWLRCCLDRGIRLARVHARV